MVYCSIGLINMMLRNEEIGEFEKNNRIVKQNERNNAHNPHKTDLKL